MNQDLICFQGNKRIPLSRPKVIIVGRRITIGVKYMTIRFYVIYYIELPDYRVLMLN